MDSSILLPLAHLDGVGEGVGDSPVAVQRDDAEVEDGGCRGQHICTQTSQLMYSVHLQIDYVEAEVGDRRQEDGDGRREDLGSRQQS